MFLILEQYFKSYPIKHKVVKGLFDHGISIRNSRLFLNDIEISISEVSKAFSVNRRTVYDTIRMVDNDDILKTVMASIMPGVDRASTYSLMGCQVISLYPMKGCFSRTLETFMSTTSSYLCHLSELSALNDDRGENYVRAIFEMPIPDRILQELDKCSCVSRIEIQSPDLDSESFVCPKCEVKTCPKKLVTKIPDAISSAVTQS